MRTRAHGSVHDTVVVIPTYCEKDNVELICRAVLQALPADVLVVDDDSPDGTGQLAEQLAQRDGRVAVLHRRGLPRGMGRAYLDGFRRALADGYRFVAQMDADFSHDPKSLPLLRQACESADLVIGSRYVRGGGVAEWTWLRRAISQGGSLYSRAILGLPIRDVTGGFKCWRASALEALDLDAVGASGFAFQIEMNYRAHRAGLRLVELPIVFRDRQRGESKMSVRIFVEGLLAVWRIRLGAGS
ncbi:MAG: polyprenol monophosphomannose synthase [Deltaproteobacteria bacterium]|nr:polyprenol monophosphomannose synthase [Deltaproteobacteria bacterium]